MPIKPFYHLPFFFSSRRRHTRCLSDWSSDVCSPDLDGVEATIWWREEGGESRCVAGPGEPFPATVFEQVHPAMGDRVRAFAVDALGPAADRQVWDLYRSEERRVGKGCRSRVWRGGW